MAKCDDPRKTQASDISCRLLLRLQVLFQHTDLGALTFDAESQSSVNTHVLIGYPDNRQPSQHRATPVAQQQVKIGQEHCTQRYIVTETVFARAEVEELARVPVGRGDAAFGKVVARLAEQFFMRDGPCHARDGYGERKQPHELHAQCQGKTY